VVPWPRHPAPLEVPLSRSDVLHTAAAGARRSLADGQLAKCSSALRPNWLGLPAGAFPGVDQTEVMKFLDRR
jgi:hypothetical protein